MKTADRLRAKALNGWGLTIKTGAFDSEATAVQWRCQAKVVEHKAECYASLTLSSVSLKSTAGQDDL